jgi:hypothetical protein
MKFPNGKQYEVPSFSVKLLSTHDLELLSFSSDGFRVHLHAILTSLVVATSCDSVQLGVVLDSVGCGAELSITHKDKVALHSF